MADVLYMDRDEQKTPNSDKLPLEARVAIGFLLNIFLILTVVFVSTKYVKETSTITNRLVDLRIPSALTTDSIRNDINLSLAALRGWILLRENSFKADRTLAWQRINKNSLKMKEFSKSWTNPNNIKIADALYPRLAKFEKIQQEIEFVASSNKIDASIFDKTTQGNLAVANEFLRIRALPEFEFILESLQKMSSNQNHLTDIDGIESRNLISFLLELQYFLLGLGVLIGSVIGLSIYRSVLTTKNALNRTIKKTKILVAEGKEIIANGELKALYLDCTEGTYYVEEYAQKVLSFVAEQINGVVGCYYSVEDTLLIREALVRNLLSKSH